MFNKTQTPRTQMMNQKARLRLSRLRGRRTTFSQIRLYLLQLHFSYVTLYKQEIGTTSGSTGRQGVWAAQYSITNGMKYHKIGFLVPLHDLIKVEKMRSGTHHVTFQQGNGFRPSKCNGAWPHLGFKKIWLQQNVEKLIQNKMLQPDFLKLIK